MVLCTSVFSLLAMPIDWHLAGLHNMGLGTELLEVLAHSPPALVQVKSIDEVREGWGGEGQGGMLCREAR